MASSYLWYSVTERVRVWQHPPPLGRDFGKVYPQRSGAQGGVPQLAILPGETEQRTIFAIDQMRNGGNGRGRGRRGKGILALYRSPPYLLVHVLHAFMLRFFPLPVKYRNFCMCPS